MTEGHQCPLKERWGGFLDQPLVVIHMGCFQMLMTQDLSVLNTVTHTYRISSNKYRASIACFNKKHRGL